tara:strand:- start:52 stop:219 length:168 start_codon:yes stop_codon:yes gene_type:complete
LAGALKAKRKGVIESKTPLNRKGLIKPDIARRRYVKDRCIKVPITSSDMPFFQTP